MKEHTSTKAAFRIEERDYTFTMDSVDGVPVLAATCERNGESNTAWTADATRLPAGAAEAEEWIRNLDWAVEMESYLDSNQRESDMGEGENHMNGKMDEIFTSLHQYAISLDEIHEALKRVKNYDDNFIPSRYTPSRNESLDALTKVACRVEGFCHAIDILTGADSYGETYNRFNVAYSAGAHRVQPYDDFDQDSGYASAVARSAMTKAADAFRLAVLGIEK